MLFFFVLFVITMYERCVNGNRNRVEAWFLILKVILWISIDLLGLWRLFDLGELVGMGLDSLFHILEGKEYWNNDDPIEKSNEMPIRVEPEGIDPEIGHLSLYN